MATTRFSGPAADVELLNSQAAWLASQLRDRHGDDPAAVSAAETIAAKASGTVLLPSLGFGECAVILAVLTSERVNGQPQPQEQWRLDRLRSLAALELDLRDRRSG